MPLMTEETERLSEILFHDKVLGYEKLNNRINQNYSYPNEQEYEYYAQLPRIDFDIECSNDIQSGNGFVISSPKTTIKKDIKDPDGIFSSRFGQKLGDLNPFIDRYSCECGNYRSKAKRGLICPKCHKICKYVDDNYAMFGWIKLVDQYPIIHPDIYRGLDSLFGKSKYDRRSKNKNKGSKLQNILDFDIDIDVNGHISTEDNAKPDEPFYGKGFLYFIENFDMIMEYYLNKYPKKKAIYDDIMMDREKVFIHSIPVYTSHLRPMDISANNMYFEKCSAMYNMMVRLANQVNKCKTYNDRNPKVKSQAMFNLQMKFNELYDEILAIISGKRGTLRALVGGIL